jgi:hypothetical protein
LAPEVQGLDSVVIGERLEMSGARSGAMRDAKPSGEGESHSAPVDDVDGTDPRP